MVTGRRTVQEHGDASAQVVDVVVIGAGAAGIAAAHDLVAAGLSVRVLEARNRIGGRVHTLRDPRSAVSVELGAEFVHGLPRSTLDIVDTAGLLLCELSGETWRFDNGSATRSSGPRADSSVAFERLNGWHGRDRSLADFLRTSGLSVAETRVAGSWVENYDAADPERISIRALIRQHRAEATSHTERTFRLPLGYSAILDWLVSIVPDEAIVFDTLVTDIEWQPNAVEVHTQRGVTIKAQQAVVCVPLSQLTSRAVRFKPALPEKDRALRRLQMGAVIKIALRFDEPFWWPPSRPRVGFMQSSDPDFGVWWTTYPLVAPLLVGWSSGAPAEASSALSNEQILERALTSLRRTFGRRAASRLAAWYLHNWQADPLAGGVYSYVKVGGIGSQARLARPVSNTLFFAGEATEHTGHHATVHGALQTGQRAAREVLLGLGLGLRGNAEIAD